MATSGPHRAEKRRRLLVTAYHYDRQYSMESRLSWQRAQRAAGEYDVTVICARNQLSPSDATCDAARSVEVVHLPLNRLERTFMRAIYQHAQEPRTASARLAVVAPIERRRLRPLVSMRSTK